MNLNFNTTIEQVNVKAADTGGPYYLYASPTINTRFYLLGTPGVTTTPIVSGTNADDRLTADPVAAGVFGQITLSGVGQVGFNDQVQQVTIQGLTGSDPLTIPSLNTVGRAVPPQRAHPAGDVVLPPLA